MAFAYIIFYGVILGLIIYSLRDAHRLFEKTLERRFLLIIAAFYTLLAVVSLLSSGDTLTSLFFISFPIFYSIIVRKQILNLIGKVDIVKAFITILFLFMVEEFLFSLGVGGNLLAHQANLILFYAILALVVTVLVIKTKLNTLTLFIIGGIIGVIFEQNFRIFGLISSGNLLSILFYVIYIFPVYGFYFTGPKILFLQTK